MIWFKAPVVRWIFNVELWATDSLILFRIVLFGQKHYNKPITHQKTSLKNKTTVSKKKPTVHMDWKVHQWTETKWSASRGKWITECLLCPVDFSQDVISHRKLHFSPFVTLNKLATEEEKSCEPLFQEYRSSKKKKNHWFTINGNSH